MADSRHLIPWRCEFADGHVRTSFEVDLSGRLQVSGSRDSQLVHYSTHGRAAMRELHALLSHHLGKEE